MRQRLAIYAMFGLFACAYATFDRVPRAAERVLRGSAEYVVRAEQLMIMTRPL
jgi:hypothetical protein